MTSNERKIINFLRDAKEKTRVRLIAKKINFSNDYTQSLCHSLARAGYIKLEDSNVCHLLEKDQGHFSAIGGSASGGENNDPVAYEPMVVTTNVTFPAAEPRTRASTVRDRQARYPSSRAKLTTGHSGARFTDEPAGAPLASDRDDKADDDVELDNALADLEPSSQKDESEEKDKPEESKDETENESRGLEEQKTEEIAEEPKEEIDTDRKEDAFNKEVLAETDSAPEQARYGAGATEEEKMEKPDETELKPESKAEEEKPVVADSASVATLAKEAAVASKPTFAEASASKEKELPEEAKAENPEKVALKEEPAKPSGGFGASFKKIINWFAEKK